MYPLRLAGGCLQLYLANISYFIRLCSGETRCKFSNKYTMSRRIPFIFDMQLKAKHSAFKS